MHILKTILESIRAHGGRPYEVGGCVRDRLLGEPIKDIDIEVFHLDANSLMEVLSKFGRVDSVGVSFGVIKLRSPAGEDFDFTLPRRENKTGEGYRGFQVEVDHTLTVEAAASRRDFTINSIYRCPLDDQMIDPFGGSLDLQLRILRATSSRFAEDPLRVLRGMQFAARFGLTIDSETTTLCQSLLPEAKTLSLDRIWIEWRKWATRGNHPAFGLQLLKATSWLSVYPELAAIVDVPQDPQWHPEGDVWTHTLHVCDVAALIARREQLNEDERMVLMFAALCHDLGKATTTQFLDGRWRAHGHCEAGLELTDSFLKSIGCPSYIIDQVKPLVAEHLVHAQPSLNARAVRRLSRRLGNATIAQLLRLIEADLCGRPPLPGELPVELKMIEEYATQENITDGSPQPLIGGKHLIAAGYAPARWFRDVLKSCYEAQMDGLFADEAGAVAHLEEILKQKGITQTEVYTNHQRPLNPTRPSAHLSERPEVSNKSKIPNGDKDFKSSAIQTPQDRLEQGDRTQLFGEGMIAIARMSHIGRAKDAFIGGMNRLFGEGNWTIGYSFGKTMIERDAALQLYEDSYVKFFQENKDVLQKLIKEASDVYDNYKSEVTSGTDWYKQEGRSIHLQDIAIRRALIRLGEEFQGKRLRKVKSDGHFPELSPGRVPFIAPEKVSSNTKVEKKWIEPKSVEDFWQNNKVFLVKDDVDVVRTVAARLKEITDKNPPEDQDRFEARRGAEFLAMTGCLDRETFNSFFQYTDKIDRLDTLRDWTYNILEMVHSDGFVAEEGSPSEKIVQLVGANGISMSAGIDFFDHDI